MTEGNGLFAIAQMPIACALAEEAADSRDVPEFVFRDANAKWWELTGSEGDCLPGRRVADALEKLGIARPDWQRAALRARRDGRQTLECRVSADDRAFCLTVLADAGRLTLFLEPLRFRPPVPLFRDVFRAVRDGVVLLDGRGKITGINRAAAEILGWAESDAVGRPYADVLPLHDRTGDPMERALRGESSLTLDGSAVLISRKGARVPVAGRICVQADAVGRVEAAAVVFHDTEWEREQRDAIVFLSYHDHLTGLYNRRFADEEIHRLDVPRQLPLSVIMGDLNGLKIGNDIFGHEMGDRLIQMAASVIRASCREEDIVSRWGGDEFLVLLPRTDEAMAEGIVRRIRSRCARRKVGDVQLSISLGCAAKTADTENFWHILQQAEEKMYHQKMMEGRRYRRAIIHGLLAALPEKSGEPDSHGQRLRRLCTAMGKACGLPPNTLADLSTLAVLHDVGQVGVDHTILRKSGPLSTADWAEIHRHPEIGYRIAHSTLELSEVAESILCHHERWDGQGYPRGLRRENIPLASRIFAVADAFDAMTNDRPYRRAMDAGRAFAELRRCAGTQFDPKIVQTFCRLYDPPAEPPRP